MRSISFLLAAALTPLAALPARSVAAEPVAVRVQIETYASGEPLRAGGDVTPPEKISGEAPTYTEMARKVWLKGGTVLIEAIVDEQGDVNGARILEGLPMGLDRAALIAVEGWKFKPATLGGKPVKVVITVSVKFRMDVEPTALQILEAMKREAASLPEPADQVLIQEAEQDGRGGRRSLDDLWQWAQGYDGPSRPRALALVGSLAMERSYHGDAVAAPALETGIAAERMLADEPGEHPEGLALWSLLLRRKAEIAADAGERDVWTAESEELLRRAQELFVRTHPPADEAEEREPAKPEAP
jgi:TonB family protein